MGELCILRMPEGLLIFSLIGESEKVWLVSRDDILSGIKVG